jgi:hypothetical protein
MVDEHAPRAPFAARGPEDRDPNEPRYTFFVSFEGSQMENAQWVAETLATLGPGHRTYFYPAENLPGNDIDDRMTIAAEADHFIAVLSDRYFRHSGYAYDELNAALGRDRTGDKRHLLWVSFEPEIKAYARIRHRVGLRLYEIDPADRADRLLDFVQSALTGRNFGYTPGVRFPDELAEYDTSVEPFAAWIPPSWNPRGTDPLPVREDCYLRVDALWARDPTPFRAVLADRPGAALSATLRDAAISTPGHRSWHHLRSLTGRGAAYTDRDAVLAALEPPVEGDGPVGIVTGLALHSVSGIAEATTRAVESFERLHRLLPQDALVLRVEQGKAADPIWTAASVARRLHDHGLVVDAATRVRNTSRTAPGGVTDNALAVVLALIRRRRQELGAGTSFDTGTATAGRVGADTAAALVAELDDGAVLPPALDEATFLRHLRDCVPELWEAVVRSWAAHRTGAGWYAGLAVSSEWSDDLGAWIEVAADLADNPLYRPHHLLGRLDPASVERVVLGLEARRDLQSRWVGATGSPSTALKETPLAKCAPDTVRRLLRRRELQERLDPADPAYWVALACSPVPDHDAMAASGITPAEVLAARALSVADPVRAQRLGYYRRLLRPEGAAS